MQMNVNGVKNAGYLEKTDRNKERNAQTAGNFRNSLADTMSDSLTEESVLQTTEKEESSRAVTGAECYQSMMAAGSFHPVDRVSNGAASECEVRNITYEECDFVKVCTEKGAVYKAQVLAEKNQVYVEQKKDDGTITGYLVDMDKVEMDTDSVVEQIAQEALEKELQGQPVDTEEAFKEALEKFYAYAEERVKNGPPKFAIGASELTIEEWDKLLERVDEEIDAAKEDLRKRVEERQEEEEQKQIDELIEKRKAMPDKGPYSFLLGDDAALTYNGVTFTYDQTGALCLGDMSDSDDVLTIYLTDGVFKLNRDNIEDLSKAISMFSPEDINRILRAISQDAKCREKLNEIEDAAFRVPEALKQD
ncbi:MAG: hypothetical protein J6B06_08030 [Lachnospiraceae bacterium]|nr:hypothetical protein [Lachnospiraceae bacterium]